MSQAIRKTTTHTLLDAIAPNRTRFTVVTNPSPARSATMALIDRLAAELAAKGPVFPDLPKEPRNPYATSWGKITDQPKFTAWEMARTRRTAWEMQQSVTKEEKPNV
jgi:hypothetical protein